MHASISADVSAHAHAEENSETGLPPGFVAGPEDALKVQEIKQGSQALHIVRFQPSGRVARVADGTTLLRAAIDAGLPLASSCDGAGICRACRVHVLHGEWNLSPPTESEHDAATEGALAKDERFACFARVHGPVTLTTSYW